MNPEEIKNSEIWFDEYIGEFVIVINMDCGGYYEKTMSRQELVNFMDFVPEGC